MSIKSDKWIKDMSINHEMIKPFSEGQVRLDDSGNKLISYGVSSYGYDVSCLLYTSPSPRDRQKSRMPSSA